MLPFKNVVYFDFLKNTVLFNWNIHFWPLREQANYEDIKLTIHLQSQTFLISKDSAFPSSAGRDELAERVISYKPAG